MAGYQNILIAVELTEAADKVIERAKEVAAPQNARLCVIHVVNPMPPMDVMGEGVMVADWALDEKEVIEGAQRQLEKLASKHGLGDKPQVLVGDIKSEIAELTQERECDLVVIGAHGRHGLDRLLGSTTDAVVHRVHCDVLAVWVGE